MLASRRHVLLNAARASVAVSGLVSLGACASSAPPQPSAMALQPMGDLELPPGFRYTAFSRTGETMTDGFFVPAAHDGMATFPLPGAPGRCVLVRNHENGPGKSNEGAFGDDHALASRLDPALIYDRTASGRPHLGGTTTMVFNTRTQALETSFLSLAGTATNCAGGPTPWGSWLTCEETQEAPGANATKLHGFVFEVPSAARSPVAPVPLADMGRFKHEAAAVDPVTGAVYQTEDDGEGLFYRFLPNTKGELAKGGKLQALVIEGQPGVDTRNWGQGPAFASRQKLAIRWVDLTDVTAPDGDLRVRGRAAGAAIFARGEGLCMALEGRKPVFYFTCTSGGAARRGQVWKVQPGQNGASDTLELFVESTGEAHFDMVDNIVAAPWGDLVFGEDGGNGNFVRGVTPDGKIYPIVRNALNQSEICGPCFSPDGTTLFFNIQRPGITYAVTGPWAQLARAARSA